MLTRTERCVQVVLLVETASDAVDAAAAALATSHPTLSVFTYDLLAHQNYARGTGPDANAVQNIVLASKMGHGQAIYYALDRLHYQLGHTVRRHRPQQ